MHSISIIIITNFKIYSFLLEIICADLRFDLMQNIDGIMRGGSEEGERRLDGCYER